MTEFIARHLDDIFIAAGSGLIVYGAYLLSVVAALFVSGLILIAFGVLIGLGNREEQKQ